MSTFARSLYDSMSWRAIRKAYKKQAGGLCERCLAKGQYVKGEIVHHKIHLTPENISNPHIAVSSDNLMLVCRNCHAELHEEMYEKKKRKRRYEVDKYGKVTANE